jgi:hypothetical protein
LLAGIDGKVMDKKWKQMEACGNEFKKSDLVKSAHASCHRKQLLIWKPKDFQKGLLPALKSPIVCIYSRFVDILHDLK